MRILSVSFYVVIFDCIVDIVDDTLWRVFFYLKSVDLLASS